MIKVINVRSSVVGMVCGALFVASQAKAVCPPDYANEITTPLFNAGTLELSATLLAVDGALSGMLNLQTQRTTSAISVLTKQKAVGANIIADANRTTMNMLATSMKVVSESERVKKAKYNVSGEFGQGYEPCITYAHRQVISSREAERPAMTRERVMSEITAAPGRYVEARQARKTQLDTNKKFCTQDQVDSGLCSSVGTLPGMNVSVASLFEPSMETEETYEAKVAFINNVAPPPDSPLPVRLGKTPEAAAYSLAKARKDALLSPALVALKGIQLDYSGVDAADSGTDIPLSSHYAAEVNKFNGNSEENIAWNQVLSGQNERGALLELLKVKAFDLAIMEKQYRQLEQQEAMLAALVSLEVQASGMTDSAAAAASTALKQRVTDQIK